MTWSDVINNNTHKSIIWWNRRHPSLYETLKWIFSSSFVLCIVLTNEPGLHTYFTTLMSLNPPTEDITHNIPIHFDILIDQSIIQLLIDQFIWYIIWYYYETYMIQHRMIPYMHNIRRYDSDHRYHITGIISQVSYVGNV